MEFFEKFLPKICKLLKKKKKKNNLLDHVVEKIFENKNYVGNFM